MISRTVVFASLALALLSCLTETVHAQIDRSDVRLTTNLIDDTRRESGNRLSNGRGESSSFVMSGPSGEGTNIRGESGSRRESGNRLSNGRGESSSFVMSGPSGEGTNIRGESGSRSESFGDSRRESGNRLSDGRGDSGSRLESFADSRRESGNRLSNGRGESGTRLESFGDSRRESSNRFSNNRDENMASSNLFGNSGRDSTMRGDRDFSSISSGNSNRDSTLTGFSGISRPTQTNENRGSSNRVNSEIINDQRDDKFRGRPVTEDNNIRNTHPTIDDSRGFHSFYEKPRGPYPYRTMYNYQREPMYHPHGGYGYGPYRPGRFHNGYRGGYGRFRRYSGGDPEEHFFYGHNWNV